MSKLSFTISVLQYQNQNTHFAFIQGDINKYTLYMYCYRKLFKQYFPNYQYCDVVNKVREGVKINFIPIWKVSCNNSTLFKDLSMIYDHVFAYMFTHPG